MAFTTSFAPGTVDTRDLSSIPVFTNAEITARSDYIAGLIEKLATAPDRRNSYSISRLHRAFR